MQVVSVTTVHKSLRENFSCGVPALDDFFKKYANQNDGRGLGRTYVLIIGEIAAGYYTINMSSMDHASLPNLYSKNVPKYPIGVGRILKLAIDLRHQKKRYGEHLLFHAIDKISEAADAVGSFAVVVDAKDQGAKEFYLKYGFIPFQDKPSSLFLPLPKD
jgi:hypothetical protein